LEPTDVRLVSSSLLLKLLVLALKLLILRYDPLVLGHGDVSVIGAGGQEDRHHE
jgi:hypothetical protein